MDKDDRKVSKICIIAPSLELRKLSEQYIKENKLDINVYYSTLDGVINLTKELVENGCKIIISRRGTYDIIKNNFKDIEVVNIKTTFIDYLYAIKPYYNSNYKFAVFASGFNQEDFNKFFSLLGLDAKLYTFTNYLECEKCVIDAINDGADIGVGGTNTEIFAKRYGLKYVVVENTIDEIKDAIDRSLQLLKVKEEENRKQLELKIKLERHNLILDYTHDGIIAVDEDGKIEVINAIAKSYLKGENQDYIGKNINDVIKDINLLRIIKTGKKEIAQMININGTTFWTNTIPIIVKNKVKGGVIIFTDIESIQKNEIKVRKQLNKKGFIAKYKFSDILGNSDAIMQAKELADSYAKTDKRAKRRYSSIGATFLQGIM
ncbi:MAG TPA: PrpR N-terminal domain-containing protein [Tissierellaceae bacterium]